MLMGIIQKPTLRSYFTTKRVISTPGFGDIMTRERLEIICKCLHFSDNESISNFQGRRGQRWWWKPAPASLCPPQIPHDHIGKPSAIISSYISVH
jgi:hypothetical protein